MNDAQSNEQQALSGIDIASFLTVLRRRIFWVLGVFLLCISLSAYITLTAVPLYKSSASVLISRDSTQVTLEDVFSMDAAQSSSFNTRITLFKSKKLAREVWEYLKSTGELPVDLSTPAAIAAAIDATPVRNTRIVDVSVTSTSPEGAAVCANAVAKRFIDWYSEESQKTTSFYTKQLVSLEEQIADANGRINEFVRVHGLVTPEMWSAYREELNSLRVEINEKNQQARTKERRINEINEIEAANGDFTALLFIRENSLISTLEKTRMEVEKELSVARQTFGPSHPRIQALTSNLQKTVEEITSISKNLVRNYLADNEYFTKELETLKMDFVKSEATAKETLTLLQEYSKLERDLRSTQSLHDIVLQKMRESGMSTSIDVEPTQIIDSAMVTSVPVSPKIKLNITLGIILGLILAIAFAYLLDYFDDTIKTAEEVHNATLDPNTGDASPIIGYIGKISSDRTEKEAREKIVALDPKTPYAEGYRSLRTSMVFSFTEPGPKVLLVTSPGSSEGKTINVTNLGIALAQNNLRTIIVDADMRKPKIHKVFQLETDRGLSTILTGNADLESVIQATEFANLSVIPCGPIPPLPNELLSGKRFSDLIASLREQFDYVVIDSPPGIVADAMVVASHVDGVAIVVRSGMTSRRHLRIFSEQLRQTNAKILGVILNDVESKMRYGYYYSYRYKYGYRYYGASKDSSDGSHSSKAAAL